MSDATLSLSKHGYLIGRHVYRAILTRSGGTRRRLERELVGDQKPTGTWTHLTDGGGRMEGS